MHSPFTRHATTITDSSDWISHAITRNYFLLITKFMISNWIMTGNKWLEEMEIEEFSTHSLSGFIERFEYMGLVNVCVSVNRQGDVSTVATAFVGKVEQRIKFATKYIFE